MANLAALMLLSSILAFPSYAAQTKSIPQENMRIMFVDDFSKPDVDITDERAGGWNWYVHPFFGGKRDPKAEITFGMNGVTLQNANISSAALAGRGHELIGRTLSGPFYIEAVLSLGPEPPHAKGWPSFWAMAAEHVSGGRDARDPGGHGDRFIEDDFFERDTKFAGAATYGATLHEWSGHYQVECPKSGFCDTANNGHGAPSTFVMRPRADIDWSQPHRVGQLYIPARPSQPGTIQNYLDGQPIGTPTHWRTQTDTFGIVYTQHLVIFLQAKDQPMTVRSLKIWSP